MPNTSVSIEGEFSGQFQSDFVKGGPLSHFLQNEGHKQEVEAQEEQIILTLDWDKEGVGSVKKEMSTSVNNIINSDESAPQSPTFAKTIEADSNISTLQPHPEEPVVGIEEVLDPEDLRLDSEELKPVTETSVPVEESVEEKLEKECVAWDFYGTAWTGIMKKINLEKDRRRHELLVLDRRKKILHERQKQIDQRTYELQMMEVRIMEVEDMIPSARDLKNLGIYVNQIIPWLETLHEKAEVYKTDVKEAAYSLARELA